MPPELVKKLPLPTIVSLAVPPKVTTTSPPPLTTVSTTLPPDDTNTKVPGKVLDSTNPEIDAPESTARSRKSAPLWIVAPPAAKEPNETVTEPLDMVSQSMRPPLSMRAPVTVPPGLSNNSPPLPTTVPLAAPPE